MIINNHAIVAYNEGTALLNKKKYERALRAFKESIKLGGTPMPELWLNIGNCYKALNKYALAAEHYEKAISLRPDYKLAENNLGLIYHGLNRNEDADRIFNECERKNPTYQDICWNKGLHLMRQASHSNTGWEEAYKYYHYRFTKESNPVRVKNDFGALQLWNGKAPGRVMVVAEQGAGDIIQYSRYVKSGMGMQADESLMSWLRSVLPPDVELSEFFDWTKFDWWIPICELGRFAGEVSGQPWAYKSTGEVPEWDFGYVWEGNPEHANNHNRSVELTRFKRLMKHGKSRSFQFGKPGFDKKPLDSKSYLDTADRLRRCRRLITVDTSIAHLAGSIGVETWVLLPQWDVDWRWGKEGDTTCWYDSVRLFRNDKGWEDVFDRVEGALIEATRHDQQRNNLVQQTILGLPQGDEFKPEQHTSVVNESYIKVDHGQEKQ